MIKLEVCDYCQKCQSFDPEVISRPETAIITYRYSMDDKQTRTKTYGDTVVMCKDRDKCKAIHEYMKGEKNDQI